MIEQGSNEWVQGIINLAHNFLIITRCQKCGAPVNKGYCCINCGDSDPSEKPDE